VSICLVICLITLLLWHASTTNSLTNVGLARIQECTFLTGDIILFQHQKYQGHGLDYLVSHLGAVLNDTEYGPLLIDINPTRKGAFEMVDSVLQFESMQLIRMSDVIHYPGKVFVRPLLKPMTIEQEYQFKKDILLWASHLTYLDDLKKRSIFTWLSLAVSTLVPEASFVLATYFTNLATTRVSSFCTEVLSTAFEKCGLLPQDKVWSYSRGPISWLFGMDPRTTLVWGREIQLS
jgi:hypothetical protein